MANFSAKEVQALRVQTGVGMMECKKALMEADGDMEKAALILREKGLAAAQKKAGRIAAEGVVATALDGNVGVIVEVNAETDFVAHNQDFLDFVDAIARTVMINRPVTMDDLMAMTLDGTEMSVQEALQEKILVIGENMNIRRFQHTEGFVEIYLHGGGRIGVLVRFEANAAVVEKPEFKALAKDIAMQVAASMPKYIDQIDVPADEVEAEKKFLTEQVVNEGKPANIAEKIVAGRINKFFEQICLLDQPFIKQNDISVRKHLEECGKQLGGEIKVREIYRYEVGEGIEKREDNFAEEVAGMMK